MPRPKTKKNFPCRYCERDEFKSRRARAQHVRQAHRNKKTKAPKGTAENPCLQKDVYVQKPINFCCFCGEQLPNATIIQK